MYDKNVQLYDNVIRFATFFDGWSPSQEVFPITTFLEQKLVGGFLVIEGPVWKCFIARIGYSESITIAAGWCYLTPKVDTDGSIISLVLSSFSLDSTSKKVAIEEERNGQ